jgi:nitroimidazol reductase NimA-like FMN-containing flavoprotein (pyridoxamine 5'-phosphate oxidase superfamily)
VYAIFDEALYCHVGFVDEGQPFVIPTIHARIGDELILHGSRQSRMLLRLSQGAPACLTVTLLDGLVLARSTFHHSMNYRSVVVLGTAREVVDADEKRRALAALVEHVIPGRSAEARTPNDRELAATGVVSFPLAECSAKVRTGPPVDDPKDLELPIWAGVLPLALVPGTPEPDTHVRPGVVTPAYVASALRGRRSGAP